MTMGRISLAMVIALASAISFSPARAADRDATIKQCVADNQGENQTPEAVASYCGCMAGKMPSAETASVTEWESSHLPEQDACAAGAKWNSN